MGYHLLQGTRANPSDFTRLQGLHWQEYPNGLYNDQSNFYITDMKMKHGSEELFFYLNKWNKHWGPGVNSLILSNKMPTFFHFGFSWKITNEIDFDYFHGRLNSAIPDTNYSQYYNYANRDLNIIRNIAGHRLEWKPTNNIIIGANELVIYANRSIETIYLVPFLSFFSLQQNVGEIDNILLSGDVKYIVNNNLSLYGAITVDEWSPPHTFKNDNRNWFGWQAGLEFNNILISNSKFHLEYTWTDHRIYRHRYSVNDYYSYGVPIGFWAGPHAEEIYFNYKFVWNNNNIKLTYSNATRGSLSEEMLEDQYSRPNENPIYKRFSEGKEEKELIAVSIDKNITSSLNVEFAFTYINWNNAGNIYNPINSELNFTNEIQLVKHNMAIALHYQF